MPGPYTNALTNGLDLLSHLGGYARTEPADAESYNKLTGAVVDLAMQFKGTYVDPYRFGTVGNGVANDFTAITNCFAAAKAAGVPVFFRKGTYKISRAIILDGFSELYIYASSSAKIVFPSADTTLTGAGAYEAAAIERSAFYLKNCTNVTIERLQFEGSKSADLNVNIGLAVSCGLSVTGLRLLNCQQEFGGGLVSQRDDAASKDAVVFACRSFGSRGNSRLGHGGAFLACTFELPTTSDYNRVGSNGSSHAIYQFASSGDDILVQGCRFVNIRMAGVKLSGTASPSYGLTVDSCTFKNCGRNHDGTIAGGGTNTGPCVEAGADDVQTHALISVTNCKARDCGQFAQILGVKNARLVGNQIYHTAALPTAASTLAAMIDVARYTSTSEPVEDVIVEGNIFDSQVKNSPIFVTNAIRLTGIGLGVPGPSSLARVRDNYVGSGYGQAFSITDCVSPIVEQNTVIRATAMALTGCRMPRIIRNDIIDQGSNNAQIRLATVAWPIIAGNFGSSRVVANNNGKPTTGDNNGGQTPQAFPLCGYFGRAQATGLRPEVVFAYGSGWSDGDVVDWNGSNTFTYKANSPGANEFNSLAGLLALLDALPGFSAADYGQPWGIITGHIRFRKDTPTASAKAWAIRTACKNPTAGVILRNSADGGGQWSYLRGEGASGDRVVIWSPCVGMGEVPRLLAENAEAAQALAAMPYPVVTEAAAEAFANAVLHVAALSPALAGIARYYWVVS